MLELIGVDGLTQWDVGRQVNVDKDVDMVHFSNRSYGYSKNVKVTDGVADVPDMFLTSCAPLRVWAYVGDFEKGYTKIEKIYEVKPKNRPEDYIYTTEDVKTWEKLQSEIGDLADLETEAKENLVAAVNEVAKCQADYEQNDETKPDFIKGRTHWIEENIEELYSNDSLNVASIEEWNFDTGIPELGCNKEIIYEIEWNGTLYKCVCNSYTYYGRTWYWYGNGSLGAPYSEFSTDSGEPFLITDTGSLISNQIGTHSISIKSFSTVYHTLDPAYLSNVESALSENSQKILNASYNDFIFKQNVSYVRDNELAQKELVNSKYYSSLNFTKHSIFAIITPKDSTYRDNTGTLYLKCKTSGSNTVNITPIKTDGSSITVDDLPTGCAILGKGFADELYLLNPKENTRGTDYEKLTNLPQINGVELLGNKTSKELGIESGTDISLGLTSASVGQIIKVKAVDESGKPTAWEAVDIPSAVTDDHINSLIDAKLRTFQAP